jgi:hypothetical protein
MTLLLVFILTPSGANPSGRYFLPLATPVALTAAQTITAFRPKSGRWNWAVAALILVYNFWGAVRSIRSDPAGMITQFTTITQIDRRATPELMHFLEREGETAGNRNHWVAYPPAFHVDERLIFVPQLPDHLDFRYTARDDRVAPYRALVDGAEQMTYITARHPALDERLREAFTQRGVAWREQKMGDFQVFYGLSHPVRSEEIGLGASTP